MKSTKKEGFWVGMKSVAKRKCLYLLEWEIVCVEIYSSTLLFFLNKRSCEKGGFVNGRLTLNTNCIHKGCFSRRKQLGSNT